ncbi:MAG: hypothetical protein Q7S12_04890 [bacterium]|nr:hypothetical protein [bacterium]
MDFQGMIVSSLSLVMIFYAIPRQIKKNYRDGKCGMDIWVIILAVSIFIARAVFSFNKAFSGAVYLYVPDAAGALINFVVLLQYFGFFLGGERK